MTQTTIDELFTYAKRQGYTRLMEKIAYEMVKCALRVHPTNMTKVAKLIKMNRTTLVEKRKRLGFKVNKGSTK